MNHPGEYKWSSYQANGQGGPSELITHHPLYLDLGEDAAERTPACTGLFGYGVESVEVDKILKAANGNFALGSNLFQEEAGCMLGRRDTSGKARRPRKVKR